MDNSTFASRVKRVRKLRNYTQVELGKLANMPPRMIYNLENGVRKPAFKTIRSLVDALDVTADFLIGRTDTPTRGAVDDPIHYSVGNLSGRNRELVRDFIDMLANRNENEE